MRTSLRRIGSLVLPLLSPVALLTAPASHADSRTSALNPSDFAVVDVQKVWATATGGAPLAPSILTTYLDGALGAVADANPSDPLGAGSIGGGVVLDTGASASATGAARTVVLPVVRLSPADARVVHRREALLEHYLVAHARYVRAAKKTAPAGAVDDNAGIAESARRANAAHVELFLLDSIAHVAGETQEQKCVALRKAQAHATTLSLTTGAVPTPSEIEEGWQPLLARAQSLYATRLAAFPQILCDQAKPATRHDAREALKRTMERELEAKIRVQFDEAKTSLKGIETEFATAFHQSTIPIDVKGIFALERAVEGARTQYEWVRGDSKNLMTPNGGLLGALEKKMVNLVELQKNGSMNPEQVARAEAALADALKATRDLLSVLRGIAAIAGFDDASRAKLGACARLPEDLSSVPVGQGTATAKDVDACLVGIADVRKTLGPSSVLVPARLALAQKARELSAAFLNNL